MDANSSAYLTIVLIAGIVFTTRILGAELMLMFSLTPRLEAFLKSMALSVFVAIVASAAASHGLRESLAVLITAGVMYFSKSSITAMVAGVMAAAAWTGILS